MYTKIKRQKSKLLSIYILYFLHVCRYVCMYVCIYVYVCMSDRNKYVCMYVYMYVYLLSEVTDVFMSVLCMYVAGPKNMYVCMYVCTYECRYGGQIRSVV